MRRLEFFLIHFIMMSVLLISCIIIFVNTKNIHIYSLVSISLTILILSLVFPINNGFNKKSGDLKIDFFNKYSKKTTFAFTITIVNVILGVASLIMLSGKINFNAASENSGTNIKNLFLTSNIISIFIVQFGGWFLQSVLLYFTCILFNQDFKFKVILNITGLSYLGFLITTLVLFLFNYFSFPENVPIEEFNNLSLSNNFSPTFGKIGEYLTLILIAIFLFNIENSHLSKMKSLLVAIIPSFVLLFLEQFFKYVF